ncbi:MAG: hypothetical protein KA155_03355 [Alphaproteobacteria bacterium]|jgi:hypothetical protein|nr:hypothetical protein [Alphaproteobacteria bacterium]
MEKRNLGETVKDITDAFGNVTVAIIPERMLGRHGMDYAQEIEVPAVEVLRQLG